MPLRITQEPASPPANAPVEIVPIETARLWLKVDTDYDDQTIRDLIEAALAYCQEYTSRALVPQALRVTVDLTDLRVAEIGDVDPWGWHETGPIGSVYAQGGVKWPLELPRPPFRSFRSIALAKMDGTRPNIPINTFTVLGNDPARIRPREGMLNLVDVDQIIFEYECGHDVIPRNALLAIKMLTADWYENRGAVTLTAADLREPNFGVSDLLQPLRPMRL
jgi:hypothetical protein